MDPPLLKEKLAQLGNLEKALLEIEGGNGHNLPHISYRVNYQHQTFYVTLAKNNSSLYVSSEKPNKKIITAFSQLIAQENPECQLTAKYKERDKETAFEWSTTPEETYKQLKQKKAITHLRRLDRNIFSSFFNLFH